MAASVGDESSDEQAIGKASNDSPSRELPLDVVFDMLKNERRRNVLDYVGREEGPFTLSELAEHIAALENEKDVAALNSSERKRVYVGLYQCHLPRMADAGVIEFDRDRGTVRVADGAEQLYPYLDVERDDRRRVQLFGAIAAVFGVGVLAGFVLPSSSLLVSLVPVLLLSVAVVAIESRLQVLDF